MRIEKTEEREVVEILEDIRIPGTDIILEKGDRIEILMDSRAKKSEEEDEEEVEEKGKKK